MHASESSYIPLPSFLPSLALLLVFISRPAAGETDGQPGRGGKIVRVLASPLLGRIDFGFGPPPNLSANPRNLALITAIYPASYSL